MKRYAIFLACAIFLLLPNSVAAAECQFVLGFKTLRDLIGHEVVGECLENEHYNHIGDSVQQTTGGLLVWRKADNWTAFTDGYRTWINGPNGLVQRLNTERFAWEADHTPGGGIATPTPSPESVILVEQAIQSLKALPLVKRDPGIVDGLRRIARISQPVFWKLLEQTGNDLHNSIEINYIADIAQVDGVTALQIVQMPFIGTPKQGADHAVLKQAKRLAESDLASLRQTLSHPRLIGGITDEHITTFVLLVLGLEHPEAAAAIAALPWVQDGVGRPARSNVVSHLDGPEALEEDVVLWLASIARWSQDIALNLVGKPWLRDGVTRAEEQVIIQLPSVIYWLDEASALQFVNMPFLQSSVEPGDSSVLTALVDMMTYSPNPNKREVLQEALSHPLLQGGIKDGQRALVELVATSKRSPEIAAAMDALPWVQDGIEDSEREAIAVLHNASLGTQRLLPALLKSPWIRDGITNPEQDVVWELTGISRNSPLPDEPAALSILDMPFLVEVDELDSQALESLGSLNVSDEQNYLRMVLSHPTLSDGISDSHRVLVSVLHLVVSKKPESHFPDLLDVLLDPAQTLVEESEILLPRGAVNLALVRPRQWQHPTMDVLERAVRLQEEFMLEAYPRRLLTLLVADTSRLKANNAKTNAPFINARDLIDAENEDDLFILTGVIAREFWFLHQPAWIAGSGQLMLQMASLYPSQLKYLTFDIRCDSGVSIVEMERIVRDFQTDGSSIRSSDYDCLYDLGLAMYLDMYSRLGDEQFRRGFRRLYVKLRDEVHEDVCVDSNRGICYLQAAFVTDADPQSAAIAELVINRWYYGSESGAPQ